MFARLRPMWIIVAVTCVIFVGIAGCASMSAHNSVPVSAAGGAAMPMLQSTAIVAAGPTSTFGGSDQNSGSKAGETAPQRLVIKNATLQVVVDNPQESASKVSQMVDEMRGWVVNSSVTQISSRSGTLLTQSSLTIRVPAERLTEALDRIKAGAVSVDSESITGQDVTQDYVDESSRVANLEAAEAQLRRIMDGATKTEDVLAVYKQLVQVRGDIEVSKGRMQYYKEASSFCSINLTLRPNDTDRPVEVAGWRPQETARSAVQALVNIAQGLANILIWLIIVGLPLVVVLGLPFWLIWRRARRTRSTRTVTP